MLRHVASDGSIDAAINRATIDVASRVRRMSDVRRRRHDRTTAAAAAARRGVSPAPIPGDKRVREQRPRQTEVSRGIHILKAAGTRLQQGVPLTLFIHLRSSGAGAAVAGAGAHGACHQVPI